MTIPPSTRLRRAITLNSPPLVSRLLRSHPPYLIRNPDLHDKSNTSLHLAASLGHIDIVRLLLEEWGHERTQIGLYSMDGRGREGGTRWEGDIEISRNVDNATPLMLAAKAGWADIVRLLVAYYPRGVAAVDREGRDALCYACVGMSGGGETGGEKGGGKGNVGEVIGVLLEGGREKVGWGDGRGSAEEEGSDDEEGGTWYGADVHVRDRDGNTPLHLASASGSLKALRMLLAAGADPFAKNLFEWGPLAYSQTVAAEVYFKNLVMEFERRKVEGKREGKAGVRLVEEEGPRGELLENNEPDDSDALRRHWSPIEKKRPMTPGGTSVHRMEYGLGLSHVRTRSGT